MKAAIYARYSTDKQREGVNSASEPAAERTSALAHGTGGKR